MLVKEGPSMRVETNSVGGIDSISPDRPMSRAIIEAENLIKRGVVISLTKDREKTVRAFFWYAVRKHRSYSRGV